MIKIIKKIIWSLLNKLHVSAFFQLAIESSLVEEGWFKSYYSKQAVDKNGNPIPWLTYSFIHFIENRLTKEMSVFEYGAGNSTIWFAGKVKKIKSVENDKEWVDLLKNKLSENCELIFRPLSEDNVYAKSSLESNDKYDIIIIDGRERVNSTKFAVNALKENGIIFFDNTQVNDYNEALEFLHIMNFKRIDFTGTLPIVAYNNTTSIFYRSNNCFNI